MLLLSQSTLTLYLSWDTQINQVFINIISLSSLILWTSLPSRSFKTFIVITAKATSLKYLTAYLHGTSASLKQNITFWPEYSLQKFLFWKSWKRSQQDILYRKKHFFIHIWHTYAPGQPFIYISKRRLHIIFEIISSNCNYKAPLKERKK